MTNIACLPQLTASFAVTVNADWRDVIQFQWAAGTANAGEPIDLTGLAFYAQVRLASDLDSILLDLSTANGLLTTNNALGELAFAVPRDGNPAASMSDLPVGATGSMDIVVAGDGQYINLFQAKGPATVSIGRGITTVPAT